MHSQGKEDEIKTLYDIISKLIPEGVGLQIILNGLYTQNVTNQQVAVFMIIYHGISIPLSRKVC